MNFIPAPSITLNAKDRWPAECKERSPAHNEKRSGLATTLTLKVGPRVMLVRDVDTEVGLFNGALGAVTGFIPQSSSLPTAVTVFFDYRRLQKVYSDRFPSLNGSFPVERAEIRIPLRKGNSFIEATRLQCSFLSKLHSRWQYTNVKVCRCQLKRLLRPWTSIRCSQQMQTTREFIHHRLGRQTYQVNKPGLCVPALSYDFFVFNS